MADPLIRLAVLTRSFRLRLWRRRRPRRFSRPRATPTARSGRRRGACAGRASRRSRNLFGERPADARRERGAADPVRGYGHGCRAGDADVVHSHTWYANFAGHLASLLYGAPHVVTAHSLEPLRPWKAEQLAGGYRLSSWVEKTAYEAAAAVIAVSAGMRQDILDCYPAIDPDRVHVVHNGIDTDFYRPVEETDVLDRLGVDRSRPSVAFVGRITRQKGVPHLLRAALKLDPDIQLILLAGAADTPELARETDELVERLRAERTGVILVSEMLPREDVRQVLTHATLFCCPSVYEPLGIVNLEAMACSTAVVASAVGGIPEVVEDGVTGVLVPYDADRPDEFEAGLARAIDMVAGDAALAASMGRAGRRRAVAEFGWDGVAARTVGVYRSVLSPPGS